MVKTRALDSRIMPRAIAVAALALLAAAVVQASALGAEPYAASTTPSMGQSVIMSRGPAFITGHVGSMDTITLPGSGVQGFLMNNGNGSSTLVAPGSVPQTVISPR
jgi:hypothetical protein